MSSRSCLCDVNSQRSHLVGEWKQIWALMILQHLFLRSSLTAVFHPLVQVHVSTKLIHSAVWLFLGWKPSWLLELKRVKSHPDLSVCSSVCRCYFCCVPTRLTHTDLWQKEMASAKRSTSTCGLPLSKPHTHTQVHTYTHTPLFLF